MDFSGQLHSLLHHEHTKIIERVCSCIYYIFSFPKTGFISMIFILKEHIRNNIFSMEIVFSVLLT